MTLIKYVYDKKGNRKGCVLAKKIHNPQTNKNMVGLGWSLCCKYDTFSKKMAILIAENRAERCIINMDNSYINYSNVYMKAPKTIKENFDSLIDRSKKYFKDVEWNS